MVKNSPAKAGDAGNSDLIPGSGRSLGKGNDNPLQCSCLEDPMDRGTWWATVHGVTEVAVTEHVRALRHVCVNICLCLKHSSHHFRSDPSPTSRSLGTEVG